MAINFPDSPSVNDTHTVGDKTWTWDGTAWNVVVGGIPTTINELTITNDLTVDTNTLYVDSTNNRLGIGTTSPATTLDVEGAIEGHAISASTDAVLNLKASYAQLQLTDTDDSTYIHYSYSGGVLRHRYNSYNANEFLTLDAVNGRVGIGTTNPATTLEVAGAAAHIRITDSDTAGTTGIDFYDSNGTADVELEVGNSTQYFAIKTAGSEAMRIDSSGNVGIGTTSPNQKLDVDGNLAVRGKMVTGLSTFTQEPWANSTIALGNYGFVGTEGSYGTSLVWNWERGTDSGYYSLGVNSYTSAAGIHMRNDGIRFQFDSSWGATSEPTTRMQVLATGVNILTQVQSQRILPFSDNTYNLGDGVLRWANIYGATGSVNSSDIRDKTDILDLDYGLEFIQSLRPVKYRFDDRDAEAPGVRTHMGFIAQEVAEAMGQEATNRGVWTSTLNSVLETTDEEGNTITITRDRQGLRYSEFIAPIVKSVQELSSMVATLTARIEALETN